jgi:uncharacterized damage-inducible protein DinB
MEILTIRSYIEYLQSVRSRTSRVVAVIPPADLEFRPRAGMFSAGDIVRHIAATERYLFVENALGRPSSYPGHGTELADGYDAVVHYLDRKHAESIDLLSDLSDADLHGRCTTLAGAEISVWKWLRAMIEHEIHHRGQLYVLLALLGVATPALYGLTERQVRAGSVVAGTAAMEACSE